MRPYFLDREESNLAVFRGYRLQCLLSSKKINFNLTIIQKILPNFAHI